MEYKSTFITCKTKSKSSNHNFLDSSDKGINRGSTQKAQEVTIDNPEYMTTC